MSGRGAGAGVGFGAGTMHDAVRESSEGRKGGVTENPCGGGILTADAKGMNFFLGAGANAAAASIQ